MLLKMERKWLSVLFRLILCGRCDSFIMNGRIRKCFIFNSTGAKIGPSTESLKFAWIVKSNGMTNLK